MVTVPAVVTKTVDRLTAEFDKLSTTQKYAVGVAGGVASLYLVGSLLYKGNDKSKPSTFELTGGSIEASKVKEEFDAYADSYGKNAGEGIVDRSKTVHLVDIFYSLVTDIYEWGWGQSFHFSPKLPNKDLRASEAAHEARIAALLRLKPGMKALDCGCGVGGPMRTVASVSGAHVTGITINQYQVDRAKHHNAKQGVAPLTNVVRGDFLNMPFKDCTFDGAYAIEATCHAPKLEGVYGEIFRVLKPGCYFVSYEWVSTHKYDPKNPEHVRIIDEINFGNGLPEMRTWKEAEDAGKNVGFELVMSLDLATASIVSGPWYERLRMGKYTHAINHALVTAVDAVGMAPKGLKEVHHMLVEVAKSLIKGGETGVFTPMHLLLFQKPEATASA
ncbi:hypothetical protein VOLCADRAFT_103647 [Volvox carteri f. nagariensis]|uniref:Methyltransferase n=1 Tax=Volvox carteri f. nagariensis TaxID=3068 RepID=D8TNL6_VOLCA|nr:uncharacterized protein VOLCADRAFT_103647 [Volvox carteri f. nagariensis]EFJ51011.1 hypothetical protein VOLCADRAFT_103647 [Volvox carteri f. nagariensis]|eukprot:XP_002948023.1 hypothetical protein VOLCADRAFT_103647 [Volvox carteri f. nagariensis]